MKRSRPGAVEARRCVGLPPSASLSGDEFFAAQRRTRRLAPRATRWVTKRTDPLPAFAARCAGPVPVPGRARRDGEGLDGEEERRIEQRRRFELGTDGDIADRAPAQAGDWARTG